MSSECIMLLALGIALIVVGVIIAHVASNPKWGSEVDRIGLGSLIIVMGILLIIIACLANYDERQHDALKSEAIENCNGDSEFPSMYL